MQTEQIVALLVAERDRLNRAIQALQGNAPASKRRARKPVAASSASAPATSTPAAASSPEKSNGRKPLSPAQRKAHSERMKAFWAARRKQKSKS
jgi:hypothetical protein